MAPSRVERSEALERARHAWTLIEGVLSREDLNVFTERLLDEKSFDEIALELQATVRTRGCAPLGANS